MRSVPRIAVIATRNRPNVLFQAYEAITGQVDQIVIINNGDFIDEYFVGSGDHVLIVDAEVMDPPNLSMYWNMGIDLAKKFALANKAAKWDVAVINDDAIVPEGWFDVVSGTMRSMQVAAACSGGRYPYPILHSKPGPVALDTRMQGFAFMLAGEKGATCNEQIYWYFTDDHLDWLSRQLGGMVMVPGYHVNHLHPNGQVTPEINEQIAKDAQTFFDYWKMRPW